MSEPTTADEPIPHIKGELRTLLSHPLRGEPAIYCQHCGDEVEAFASVTIKGASAGYRFRHVESERVRCDVTPPFARPYDEYAADFQITTLRQKGPAT